ncbi:MAG: hypothetical protein U1F77_12855 [Kiritimatiellia bacterium]
MSLQNHFEPRAWRFWCAVLLGVYLFTTPGAWQCEGVDEVEYLSLAHSVRLGLGYSQYGTPHVLYPPLYPVLLSPLMAGPDFHWKALYALNALMGWGALVTAGAWLRRGGAVSDRAASWFLVGSYYGWSFSTRFLMPEPLFLLLAVLTLGFCKRQMRGIRFPLLCAGLTAGLALLAAAAKTAAIALGAGLAVSALLRARGTRTLRSALPGLAACTAVCAFTLAWEIRGARVSSDARESYGRWILHLTGLQRETDGMIAREKGEDRELRRLGLAGRVLELGERTGQYVVSFPRPPWNFKPLGLMLAACVLYGSALRLRRAPHDPLVWYGLVSMAMFALTNWTSSYLRYLYVVSPWLFGTLADALPHAALANAARNPWVRVPLATFCLWGLFLTFFTPEPEIALKGGALAFQYLSGTFCATVYTAGLILVFRPPVASIREFWVPVGFAAACMLWLFLTLMSGAFVRERWHLARTGQLLKGRNLTGMVRAGGWVRDHAPPPARIISSMPAFASLLTGRVAREPLYQAGRLQSRPGDLLITPGDFEDFYAYRLRLVCGFRDEIRRLQREGALERVFSMDGSEVYQVR